MVLKGSDSEGNHHTWQDSLARTQHGGLFTPLALEEQCWGTGGGVSEQSYAVTPTGAPWPLGRPERASGAGAEQEHILGLALGSETVGLIKLVDGCSRGPWGAECDTSRWH